MCIMDRTMTDSWIRVMGAWNWNGQAVCGDKISFVDGETPQ